MKKLVLDLQPYPILKTSERLYSFSTDAGCVYHCYFVDFSSIFSDYPQLAPYTFGFNLELKYQPTELINIGLDNRIAATVAAILQNFLNEVFDAIVYVCDNSDNREKARFHKFNNWFKLYNKGTIIQLRGSIRAGNTDILNAMFIHKDNPQLNDFIEAYEIITGIFTKPDDEELDNIMNEAEW